MIWLGITVAVLVLALVLCWVWAWGFIVGFVQADKARRPRLDNALTTEADAYGLVYAAVASLQRDAAARVLGAAYAKYVIGTGVVLLSGNAATVTRES